MEILSPSVFWILFFFVLGYLLIILEQVTEVSKTTVALLMAVTCWTFQFTDPSLTQEEHRMLLSEHIGKASEVVLFLLCALAIVEVINVHNGFWLITSGIKASSQTALLWIIGIVAFFASAVLDNLTTTVVLVTLLRKLIQPGEERALMGGAVVIAANAGGAWTPIGDVTTTMLWIGGHITAFQVMKALFIPSVICVVLALLCLHYQMASMRLGEMRIRRFEEERSEHVEPYATLIFCVGVGCLIFVPLFKQLTGLPPLMGMVLGLGSLWLITDLVHRHYHDRQRLRVPSVLSRIDLAGVLFFLGILLAVDTLDTSGILEWFSLWIDSVVPNDTWTAFVIGIASAVVDNVPLVAAAMKMYNPSNVSMEPVFWHQIAFAAGTGGSILIIGSAAGVAFMGLERVGFLWWMRRVSVAALIGYLGGFGMYTLISPFTG